MPSIKSRLFVILILATGMIWLSAALWILASTQRRVEQVLDARLVEAARMVSSLMRDTDGAFEGALRAPAAGEILAPQGLPGYERQLSCQIWSLDGRLLGASAGAPGGRLGGHASGFSTATVDGEQWRVFALEDPARGVRILVGDNLKVRNNLVADLLRGLLVPALMTMPALVALIWVSLSRGLRPLRQIAESLSGRGPDDLAPLAVRPAASELRPVIAALNGLFAKLAEARDRERQFTAFAAHELRTPLAGLRTQAQVALAAGGDEAVRTGALKQILLAVDRTARLVRQLLELSRLDSYGAEAQPGRPDPLDLAATLNRLADELKPLRRARSIDIEIAPSVAGAALAMDASLFEIATRNLLENAVQHAPAASTVRVTAARGVDEASITVADEGPGIPADEIELVRERFFRGRHKSDAGSGLGLAIVDLALRQGGASLRLRNRAEGGLAADIVVPPTRLQIGSPEPQPARAGARKGGS